MTTYVTEPLTEHKWRQFFAPDWVEDPTIPSSADMCSICKSHHESQGKPWPPCGIKKTGKAKLNSLFQYEGMVDEGLLDPYTDKQKIDFLLQSDPVTWAESEFIIDGHPWTPRWYQSMFMRCTSTKKAALWGRRAGKSEAMLVLALWHARYRIGLEGSDKEYYIQIFINSEQLAKKHYDEMFKFINTGRTLKDMIRSKEKGKRIQLTNNVTISFNVLSMKQIGQDAHFMWFDEAAFYESEEHFSHATAVKLSRPETPLIMTSNSSGFRGKFYEFCNYDDTYTLQLPSYVNPDWDIDMELFSRQNYNAHEYEILIKAEWGSSQDGVFKPSDIEACIKKYPYSRLQCSPLKPEGVFRVLGNDWNESANGVHFVIVECDTKHRPRESGGRLVFKTVHKEVVSGHSYNHEVAIAKAMDLLIRWQCDAAFLDDGGGGSISVERLVLKLKKQGKTTLASRVTSMNMSALLPVPDYNGGITKKRVKNLITNVAQILCENHQLAWPIEETEENTANSKAENIIPQMRAYKVAKWDQSGRAVYESTIGIDHTLTAWLLALYGLVVNTTGLVADKLPSVSYMVNLDSLPSEEKSKTIPDDVPVDQEFGFKHLNKVNRAGGVPSWGNKLGRLNRSGGSNKRSRW